MARTAAALPGGPRLSDYLSIGVLAHVFPRSRSRTDRTRAVYRERREERVVSSRGQRHPRGVKRNMSNNPIRRAGPLDRRRHTWTPLTWFQRTKWTVLPSGPLHSQTA